MNCFQPKCAWQILISSFKGALLAQFPTYTSTATVFQGGHKTKGDFALKEHLAAYLCSRLPGCYVFSPGREELIQMGKIAGIFQVEGCIILEIFFLSKSNSVILALAKLERAQEHINASLNSFNFHLNYSLLWWKWNRALRYHHRSTTRDSSITGTLTTAA